MYSMEEAHRHTISEAMLPDSHIVSVNRGTIGSHGNAGIAQSKHGQRTLPVPGGPNMSTPFHGRRMPVKKSGISIGHTTASSSSFLACSKDRRAVWRSGGRNRNMNTRIK